MLAQNLDEVPCFEDGLGLLSLHLGASLELVLKEKLLHELTFIWIWHVGLLVEELLFS